MPDSRVDRVARYAATQPDMQTPANFPGTFHDLARATIHTFEAAGILVIDPDDEATIRVIAGCDVRIEYGECAWCGSAPCGPHGPYEVCFEHDELASECPEFKRVVAALAVKPS